MNDSMKRVILLSMLCLCVIVFWISCERPTAPPNANKTPHTKLANVPSEGDTIFPLATLNWTGGDNDGFVARFQYRYVTYHLANGSTTEWVPFDSTNWKDTTATSLTIAFNSNQDLNKQFFFVRAIDNEGAVDPNPVSKIIYTTKASPPATTILSPQKNTSVFILNKTTDWWTGIILQFKAVDKTVKGKVVEYAWSVDGGPMQWVVDTSVIITPEYFKQPLLGNHYIKVISRNNTNLIDPIGDSTVINLLNPTFEKNVLIIDETDEFNTPFIGYGTPDSAVDNFYSRVFPGSDSWDYKAKGGMPPRDTLAHYKLIVWHADDRPVSLPHKISDPKNIVIFSDYLKVGGKFLMSGWGILKSFAYTQNFPFTFLPGTFVNDFLHIKTVDETPLAPSDCIGGVGTSSKFTGFRVDSLKLPSFPYNGMLTQVNLITVPASFTEGLYSYENLPNSSYPKYRGRYIGLRYYGTVYDAAVLGFPLYFIKEEDAKVMAKEILQSLKVQ
jgi:hypothetical protein